MWIPLGLQGSSPSARPIATVTIALLMVAAALVQPAEQADLAELNGWSEFVRYMASHPTLRTPTACAALVAGDRSVIDDAVPGDPREAKRRCDRVVTQLNLSGWRRVAFVPSRGVVQIGTLGHAFVHRTVLFAWLHAAFLVLLIGPMLEGVWGARPLLGVYGLGAVLGATGVGLLFKESAVPVAGASFALAACTGAFLTYFRDEKARYWVLSVHGTRVATAPVWGYGVFWLAIVGLSLFRGEYGVMTLAGQLVAAIVGAAAATAFERAEWIPARATAAAANAGPVIARPRMPSFDPGARGDVDAAADPGQLADRLHDDDVVDAVGAPARRRSDIAPAPSAHSPGEDAAESTESADSSAKKAAPRRTSDVVNAATSRGQAWTIVQPASSGSADDATLGDRSPATFAASSNAGEAAPPAVADAAGDVSVSDTTPAPEAPRPKPRAASDGFDPTADLDFAPATHPELFAAATLKSAAAEKTADEAAELGSAKTAPPRDSPQETLRAEANAEPAQDAVISALLDAFDDGPAAAAPAAVAPAERAGRTNTYGTEAPADAKRALSAPQARIHDPEAAPAVPLTFGTTREAGIARAISGGYLVQFGGGGEGLLLRRDVRAVAVGLVPAEAGKRSLVTVLLVEKGGRLELWRVPLVRMSLESLAHDGERPAETWSRVVLDVAAQPEVVRLPKLTNWPGPPYVAFDQIAGLEALVRSSMQRG